MKIAIFSDNFYPEISGISDSICMTAKELGKRGNYVNIYAPKYSKKDYKFLNLKHKEINLGKKVKIIRFPSLPFKTGTSQGRVVFPSLFHLMEVKKFNPDVIHIHLPFGVGLDGLIASKLLKIPLVGTNHTPMSEFVKYSPIKSNLAEKAIMTYNYWFFDNCNFVSSPSGTIFKEAKKYGHLNINRKVVPNPINSNLFKPSKSKKEKYNLSDFVILYSGRLSPEKRVDEAIKAFSKLVKKVPYAMFAITGRGAAEKQLKELVKSLNLEKAVKFFGFLSLEELAELYNSSEVFIIVSTAESQSLAAMQAFACGIPVIGANSFGLPEYIAKDRGFLVKPGDINAIYQKMLQLYLNPKLRKRLGENGIAFARTLSPEKIAEEWEKIYKQAKNPSSKR